MTNFINTYKDFSSPSVRDSFRGAAIASLRTFQVLKEMVNNKQTLPRVQFIYLHFVFEDEVAAFRSLLKKLSKIYTFVSHDHAVSLLLSGKVDRPYLSVSFDDGLKSNITAAHILEEFGTTAHFFVCPNVLDNTDYPDKVAFAKRQLNMPPVDFMSWADLEELQKRGHGIGSHTNGHCRIWQASSDSIAEEIFTSKERLERNLGPIDHFAWPYGRFFHFVSEAREMVFKAGYKSCASAERGCHLGKDKIETKNLCIRRDLVVAANPNYETYYFLSRNTSDTKFQKDFWPNELQ